MEGKKLEFKAVLEWTFRLQFSINMEMNTFTNEGIL